MNKENEWENDPDIQDFLEHVDKQGPWDSEDDKIHTIGGLTNDKDGSFMEFQKKMDGKEKELATIDTSHRPEIKQNIGCDQHVCPHCKEELRISIASSSGWSDGIIQISKPNIETFTK